MDEHWTRRFQRIPKEYIAHFGLRDDVTKFLTTVGLPDDLRDLQQAIEVNFYFDRARILRKTFKGVNYVIIGDDSGALLGISLEDSHVFALEFNETPGIAKVCFVNSGVQKFIEALKCFIDCKGSSEAAKHNESQSRALLKANLMNIDKPAIANDGTWWRQIIDDPIDG